MQFENDTVLFVDAKIRTESKTPQRDSIRIFVSAFPSDSFLFIIYFPVE